MKKTQQQLVKKQRDVARHARLVCLVSDDEMRIIDSYLRKYKIENKIEYHFGRFKCFCQNDISREQLIPEKK